MSHEPRRDLTEKLRAVAVDAIRDKHGVELSREPGRRQVYAGSDGKRYQLRISDWLGFLEAATGNHWDDPIPALEGPNAADFLLISTTSRNDPRSALVYCVPADVASHELHTTHQEYCSDTEDGRKGDTRRALRFRPPGQRTTHKAFYDYDTKWRPYLVAEVPLLTVEPRVPDKPLSPPDARPNRTIADVKAAAAREIAALAGVTPDKILIDIRITD